MKKDGSHVIDVHLGGKEIEWELSDTHLIALGICGSLVWLVATAGCGLGCYYYAQKAAERKQSSPEFDTEMGSVSGRTVPSAIDDSVDV